MKKGNLIEISKSFSGCLMNFYSSFHIIFNLKNVFKNVCIRKCTLPRGLLLQEFWKFSVPFPLLTSLQHFRNKYILKIYSESGVVYMHLMFLAKHIWVKLICLKHGNRYLLRMDTHFLSRTHLFYSTMLIKLARISNEIECVYAHKNDYKFQLYTIIHQETLCIKIILLAGILQSS